VPAAIPLSSDAGPPPIAVIQDQLALSAKLDALVPGKVLDRNLLVASWNVRVLGTVGPRWTNDPNDSPKRNLADVWALAEIISRFDVVAVQEVRDDLIGLRLIARSLGAEWSFIVTDVVRGAAGNHERLAFLFDQRRVKPSGLAGELVLSAEDTARLEIGRQFARTPFLVSFVSAGNPFTLASVHVIWGDDVSQRAKEAGALADLLRLSVKDPSPKTPDDFRRNLIALGDFNIAKEGDAGFQALVNNGLTPDPSLADLPRTVGETPGKVTAFDQVAWIAKGQEGALGFDRTSAGTIQWDALLERDPAEGDSTFRISDHYPLWVEFALPAR
jgi:endonuclease/exonuclease/phosphatase family metal-dependent hydrolase